MKHTKLNAHHSQNLIILFMVVAFMYITPTLIGHANLATVIDGTSGIHPEDVASVIRNDIGVPGFMGDDGADIENIA